MAGDDLPFITSDELRTKRLAHYALLVGDTLTLASSLFAKAVR